MLTLLSREAVLTPLERMEFRAAALRLADLAGGVHELEGALIRRAAASQRPARVVVRGAGRAPGWLTLARRLLDGGAA